MKRVSSFEQRKREAHRLRRLRKARRRAALRNRTAEKLSGVTVRVVAPPTLSVLAEYEDTIRFVERIAHVALVERKRAFVDLSQCKSIQPEAALILAAQIERCRAVAPQGIAGRAPLNVREQLLLEAFGFFQLAGIPVAQQIQAHPEIAAMRSGNTPNPSDVDAIYAVISHVLDIDPALERGILGAMGEALINVRDHAYPVDWPGTTACLNGRWWLAGATMADGTGCIFMAYDQGQTIPGSLPKTLETRGLELKAFLKSLFGAEPTADQHLIKAAMEVGASRTGLAERGKGLPQFKSLIDKAGGGSLMIWSGRGRYLYGKSAGSADDGVETFTPLAQAIDGTLILWSVQQRKSLDRLEQAA